MSIMKRLGFLLLIGALVFASPIRVSAERSARSIEKSKAEEVIRDRDDSNILRVVRNSSRLSDEDYELNPLDNLVLWFPIIDEQIEFFIFEPVSYEYDEIPIDTINIFINTVVIRI